MLAAAGVVVVAAVIGGVVVLSGADHTTAAAQAAPANTAQVRQGKLSAVVSQAGTLTYRARPDGSPYAVINQARGVYTELPDTGDKVDCGGVLYRVDEQPVLLLCGTVPAYRALHDRRRGPGRPTAQPQPARARLRRPGPRPHRPRRQRLHRGDRAGARAAPAQQGRRRRPERWPVGDVVFLPEAVRIAKVSGRARCPRAAGCARPERHVRHAARAGRPRPVTAGPGQGGRPRADHAAGQHDRSRAGSSASDGSPKPRPGATAAPRTRPSPPPSASTTHARPAGSTEPRSEWRSPPRAWTTP